MTQSTGDKKIALAKAGNAQPVQARLILQDPVAFDQSSQPALRSSLELVPDAAPAMDREKARELWENLSLEPEQALEKQSERKRLLSRSQALAKDAAAAQAEVAALKAQIAKQDHDRFNHPLIYAGAAAALGLGALFWLERRKRLLAEDREIDALASRSNTDFDAIPSASAQSKPRKQAIASEFQYSEFSEELAQEFATDLPGLPVPQDVRPLTKSSLKEQPVSIPAAGSNQGLAPATEATAPIPPAAVSLPDVLSAAPHTETPTWAQPSSGKRQVPLPADLEVAVLSTRGKEEQSLLSLSKTVLRNMLARKSNRDATGNSHLPTELPSSQSTGHHESTLIAQDFDEGSQWDADQEAQFAFEQELRAQQLRSSDDLTSRADAYDPDLANIELLSQTRVKPVVGENVMEHLLELRTAVNGLCVLGRSEGATRLLLEHIEGNPDTCAWAYLEYMHICEQQDERDGFELMRKRYRQQFNRMAPYWFEPNSNVLGLDGYARATGELCAVWAQGKSQARQAIGAWLVGPMIGRKLVQLPAYHDLFDLYELLEFVEEIQSNTPAQLANLPLLSELVGHDAQVGKPSGAGDDFVPTVSLLDLDYEFSSDVTLEEKEVQQAGRSVTIVKTGNFSVDFNVAGTQMGSISSVPAELPKK